MKKQHVKLSDVDREFLENLINQGEATAKIYRRTLALLELNRGQTYTAVSKTLQLPKQLSHPGQKSIRRTGCRFLQTNLAQEDPSRLMVIKEPR